MRFNSSTGFAPLSHKRPYALEPPIGRASLSEMKWYLDMASLQDFLMHHFHFQSY